MASAFPSTDSDLRDSIDKSILPGFSEHELLNLFKTSEVQSWDRVFYRLGLPMLQEGLGKRPSLASNIITKLLTLWVEHGDSSRNKLMDILLQLQETNIFSKLASRNLLELHVKRRRSPGDGARVVDILKVKWKERCELARTKFADYLSNQRDVIHLSEEPEETLAKRFFEGCLTEIDFSPAAKQVILKEALIDVGFTHDTIDPKVIATWFNNKEQLLGIVKRLSEQPHIQRILSREPDYMQDNFHFELCIGPSLAALKSLMSSIIYCTSYTECMILLQNAVEETGLSPVWAMDNKVTPDDIRIVGETFPVEKAENLSLALEVQKEEVDSLRTTSMSMYRLYNTLSQWSKGTPFSRHKLFLTLCLSGYFDFATSHLYDMKPSDALVTKSFSQSGGDVNLEDHGIRLSVPMGALSGNQKITLTILEEGPLMPSVDEVSICPGFRVSPSGLIFNSPSKVSLDHWVTVLQREQACTEGIVVYIRQEEGPKEQWKLMRYDLSTSTDCPVKVTLTQDKAEVYLTHFTSFWIRVKSVFIGSKRIGCTPFLPKYMPANRKPVLRLYVHNTSASTVKSIQEEEENCCPVYCQTTPHYDFTMIPNRGKLTVTCTDEGSSMLKTVSYEDLLTLRRHSQNRLEFELDFTSLEHGEKNVKVDLFQGDEKTRRDMIIPTTFQESVADSGDGVPETVEDIATRMDDLSLESEQASSQSDASAAAAIDEVTKEQLMDIAVAIPGENFVSFFVFLGFPLDYPHKVLERWCRSYRSASEQLLCEWAVKYHSNIDELRNALVKSKLQFLALQYLPSSSQE